MATYKIVIYDKHFDHGFKVYEADALPVVDAKAKFLTFKEKGKLRDLILRKKSVLIISEL